MAEDKQRRIRTILDESPLSDVHCLTGASPENAFPGPCQLADPGTLSGALLATRAKAPSRDPASARGFAKTAHAAQRRFTSILYFFNA